jgi:hypothetical protein
MSSAAAWDAALLLLDSSDEDELRDARRRLDELGAKATAGQLGADNREAAADMSRNLTA